MLATALVTDLKKYQYYLFTETVLDDFFFRICFIKKQSCIPVVNRKQKGFCIKQTIFKSVQFKSTQK